MCLFFAACGYLSLRCEELASLIMIVDDFADELAESQHLASPHRTAPLDVSVPPGVTL